MNWFSNLKIGKKLVLGFGLVEVLMIVLGIFSIVELSKVNNNTVDIATNWLPSVRTIADLRFDASALRRDTINYVVTTEKKSHYEEKMKAEFDMISSDEKAYESMISSDEERKLYQGFRDQWDKYLPVRARVM